jgi:hypothetical protein
MTEVKPEEFLIISCNRITHNTNKKIAAVPKPPKVPSRQDKRTMECFGRIFLLRKKTGLSAPSPRICPGCKGEQRFCESKIATSQCKSCGLSATIPLRTHQRQRILVNAE